MPLSNQLAYSGAAAGVQRQVERVRGFAHVAAAVEALAEVQKLKVVLPPRSHCDFKMRAGKQM